MKNHLMLDLETLGVNPGCAILSFAAMPFDLKTGTTSEPFYTTIDLNSSINAGLKIEPDTFKWWMKQNDQARGLVSKTGLSLEEALRDFQYFISIQFAGDPFSVWGNSSSFDCSILKSAYDICKLDLPWNVFNERDYRTVKGLFPANLPKKDSEKAHDPIYDCEYQIECLVQILNSLK